MLYKGILGTMYSGSVDGLVAAHNRGGTYFRNRVVPTDPETARQVNCREALAACYTKWATVLTEQDRQDWARFAASQRRTNRIGDERPLSGWPEFSKQKFLAFQANEQLGAAFAVGAVPPQYPQPFTTMPYALLNADNESLDVYWSEAEWPALDDHAAIFVFASGQRPATRNFFKGPYQLKGMIAGDPETPPTSPVKIPLGYTVTSAFKVFYRLRFWGDDFLLGPPFIGHIQRA